MDDLYKNQTDNYLNDDGFYGELDAWFMVSGDTDDFIFYDEDEKRHSCK